MITLFAVLALVIAACAEEEVVDDEAPEGLIAAEFDLSGATFTVGSKEFTEQLILGWLALEALEAAGATVNNQIGLGGTGENRIALEAGEIDMYWEYTGTGWITHLGETVPVFPPEAQWEVVAERDLEENSIRWLEAAEPNNSYTLAATPGTLEDLGITSISELEAVLAERPEDVTICGTDEFLVRDDGIPGMEAHYGFQIPEGNAVGMDPGIMYTELERGEQCNFAGLFQTDGRIAAFGFVLLEDDQDFWPIYQPALNVREEVFQEWPQLEDLFALVVAGLDTETLTAMNGEVDVDGAEPRDVARRFLQENGLIP